MWNNLVTLYSVGGEDWVQKTYGEKLENYPLWMEYYDKVQVDCKSTRDYILANQVYDGLDDLFEKKPWDWPE